MAVEMGL